MLALVYGVIGFWLKDRPGLFVFNTVAVISYPDLSDAGLKDHMLWGALLLVTLVYGPGKLSLDHWLGHRFGPGAR